MHESPNTIPALQIAIEERRDALNKQNLNPQSGRWGIALSGGGIRSAVFGYGLISALAKSKVLWRFDLLSTVSGGGYFGSALGKLACIKNAQQIQDELSKPRSESEFQQQMRASNRYLTPKGTVDLFYIAAIYLRNILAVHVELLLLCVVLSALISMWDIAVWYLWESLPIIPTVFDPLQTWITNVIIFSPLLLLTLPACVCMVYRYGQYWYSSSGKHGRISLKIDSKLSVYLKWIALIILLSSIDMVAQRLSNLNYLFILGGFYSGVLVVLRFLMPLLHLKRDAGTLLERKLFMLLDIAGFFGLMILVIFWMSVFHSLVTHQLWQDGVVTYSFPAIRLTWVLLAALLLLIVKMNNWSFLNRSSLHQFYRLRLGLSWLGFDKFNHTQQQRRETDVNPAGDLRFSDYKPWQQGGAVHLINVCLNDTSTKTGDRQGHQMSLLGGGYFTLDSCECWTKIDQKKSLSLATWVAISGAATAPGMGMMTRPGLASLFTSLGVRLGYWWQFDNAKLSKRALKYWCLYSELFGKFSLEDGKPWFLSDGGHAENTATWALLKARCELIIVADAAADPDYGFNDVENLIRRARADLNIHIEFVMPANNPDGMFGSLDDLGDPQSIACLSLARIRYSDHECGLMILVKPNLTNDLPDDVFNYARDNPKFPQQSTVDQFYDEAQWESYFALGQRLGRPLTLTHLQSLLDLEGGPLQPLPYSPILSPSAKPLLSRRPTRITRKAGAAASLGLATILTSGSGMYAALQQASGPVGGFDMSHIYQQLGEVSLDAQTNLTPQAINKLAAMILMLDQKKGHMEFKKLREREPQLNRLIKDVYDYCYMQSDIISCKYLFSSSIGRNIKVETSPMVNAREYWRSLGKLKVSAY